MIRNIPDIPRIKAHWERRSDPTPYLMVPMSDGTTIRYNAEIPQPSFRKAMDNIRNMAVGYEKKEPAAVAAADRRSAKERNRNHSITEGAEK